MAKKTLTRVVVLVVALLMCVSFAFTAFAADSVTETLTPKDNYITDHTWTSGSNTTYNTVWQGDRYAEGYYHVYYVGGVGASDTNDGLTEETSFATIYRAMKAAKDKKYLDDVLATAENMHHTKIVLLGDTNETRQDLRTGAIICGGIVTITAKEGVNATVHVGTSATKMVFEFLLLNPRENGKGYAELNLGEPDMKGTVSFDCTYFNSGDQWVDWRAVIRLGNENPDTNSVARMYDGFSIKNLSYDDVTGNVIENTNRFVSAIMVDYGTFYMYGGTIENCYTNSQPLIFVHSRETTGLGFYMYGGVIQNCYSKDIIKADKSVRNNTNPVPKVAIYGGLIKNNYTSVEGIAIDYGTCVVYGGTFENNYYENNSKSLLGDWESNGGKLYYSDSVKFIFDAKFTDLKGTERNPAERTTVKGTEIKSVVVFANDGSAVGYGSTDGSAFTIKDASVVSAAISALNYEKAAEYDIYTMKDTNSCEYAVADGTAVSAASSATYYTKASAERVHDFTVETDDRQDATDDLPGYIVYKCAYCDETNRVTIPPLSHEHNYVITVIAPTCTEQGYTIKECECGDRKIEDYKDALDHDYSGAGTVVTKPTCTTGGYTTYTCQREGCGETHNGNIVAATGHDYEETVIKAYTLTEVGKSKWICKNGCGSSVERTTYPTPDEMVFTVTVTIDGVSTDVQVPFKTFVGHYNYEPVSETKVHYVTVYNLCFKDDNMTITVDGVTFNRTQITSVKFPLGIISIIANNGFRYLTNLESVDFSTTDGLILGEWAFANTVDYNYTLQNLRTVKLGNNMKLNKNTFRNCSGLETVIVTGKTAISDQAFREAGNTVKLSVYILSEEGSITGYPFVDVKTPLEIYTKSSNITKTLFENGSTTPYTIYLGIAHPYELYTFAATCTEKGYDGYVYIDADGSNKEAVYGTTYKVFTNVPVTSTVYETVTLSKTVRDDMPALGHLCENMSSITSIKYANGFDKTGATKFTCERCQEENCDSTIEAMFKALGYATHKDNTSIYGGFEINLDTLGIYEQLNGKIKFGLIGGNAGTDLTFVGGVLQSEKAFQVEMTDRVFSKFGIMLNGFDPAYDKYINFKFVMAVYVIDEKDNMTFMQKEAETVEGVENYYADKVNFTIGENKTELGAMTLKQIVLIQSKGTIVLVPTKTEETV